MMRGREGGRETERGRRERGRREGGMEGGQEGEHRYSSIPATECLLSPSHAHTHKHTFSE